MSLLQVTEQLGEMQRELALAVRLGTQSDRWGQIILMVLSAAATVLRVIAMTYLAQACLVASVC